MCAAPLWDSRVVIPTIQMNAHFDPCECESFPEGIFFKSRFLCFFAFVDEFDIVVTEGLATPNFPERDFIPVPVFWVVEREDCEELIVYRASTSFSNFRDSVQLNFRHLALVCGSFSVLYMEVYQLQ